jgi:predicted GIY-YIG superfamily endonuclease
VPHFVYILRCADDSLYIGETARLQHRLEHHQAGDACIYTRHRRPVTLAYAEEHSTRLSARQRERQLKRWTRAKKEALIARRPSTLEAPLTTTPDQDMSQFRTVENG